MSVPEGKVKVLSLNNRLNILGLKCLVFSLEGGPVMTFGSIFGNLSPETNDRWLWSSQQCNYLSQNDKGFIAEASCLYRCIINYEREINYIACGTFIWYSIL